ncbi:glycosyltransferase [Lentibacter algarum]|uniref:glycosyltransferase family 2 protein n=1 Tax=Lentibacter algarum TaxID=576131 RepID=UPI001C0930C9|nr:glycosyltransferase [Lentibacter algarum]MBU2983349.1 glycosyltransferase [Lentibacter algarum]
MAGLSIILPASNEAEEIGGCLESLLKSDPKPGYGSGSIPVPMPIEVVVVANGCSDQTVDVARKYAPRFAAMGWDFTVLDLAEGGKMGALNAGDAVAMHRARAYLDADVRLGAGLLDQLARVLQSEKPIYASGQCVIAPAQSWATRAYARIYAKVPFMTHGTPGCGLFGVSASGRRRWGKFPDIISDDTYVRLSFAPEERLKLRGKYAWPLVEGYANLIKVRRRQNTGVTEIKSKYQHLMKNDDKLSLGRLSVLSLVLKDPIGFAVYSSVIFATRFGGEDGWSRGR